MRPSLGLFDLTGKVAIVTGSTKGIGRAAIEGLAAAGAAVVVTSRKQELCESVADDLRTRLGVEVLPLACHVGDWDAVGSFVDRVVQHFGRIDILVNNAGINPSPTPVADLGLDLWRKIFAVNVEGPLRMSQCVAPVMKAGGGGSIVHVGSMTAHSGAATLAAYSASKAALVNLSKSMAAEWAPFRIRVNSLSPGPFMTEMLAGAVDLRPEYAAELVQGTTLKRIADTAEIVGPLLYLASDASSFVTGEDARVCGGSAA